MPRSTSSYHRRHRKRSDSSNSSREEREEYYKEKIKKKNASDLYYSRSSSKHKSKSRSQSCKEKSKKRVRRSRSSTSESESSISASSNCSAKSSPPKEHKKQPEVPINLNLLDGKINTQILDEINEEQFQQKIFTSNKPMTQKVIIDLNKDTITIPNTIIANKIDDSLFHPNFLGDESKSMENWVKKLYNYRQRLVNE